MCVLCVWKIERESVFSVVGRLRTGDVATVPDTSSPVVDQCVGNYEILQNTQKDLGRVQTK